MFTQFSPELTNTSYEPNYIVSEIRQQQKDLSDDEIRQIALRFSDGAIVYELARDFDCHRSTIRRSLKKQGITVSNKVTDQPALVEQVLKMCADGMHGKEIASQIGITPKSVSKILHNNDVRIRHSSEYTKETSR